MLKELIPVNCPSCGEAQNTMPDGFDPRLEPFGPVECMVCGHNFSQDEYLKGLKAQRNRIEMWQPPKPAEKQ
ncbi:MAG: hypothetical protein CFH06_01085 [Alphaproteobacteria bacterium MarineAlpha3_Bin5]|nr:MAG: hypothetical protein CFH06_01085 [Alphaproteobacteria bacterium MarineAlpha3_Bin5]|tara:strand:+ start:28 stop:243 length:216 start_codon:yes stop_codon:yes gene_type:complete